MSRSRWPRVLRMVLGSVALAGATGSVRPAPERASVPPATRVEDTRSVACGACHPAEHAAWSRSAHHLAGTDPLFTRELETAMEPAWCTGCHAPLGASEVAREEGVGCAVCHVRDGVVLSPSVSGRAPHASVASSLAAAESCAPCHQFHFSAASSHGIDPSLWPQDTMREHADSAFADRPCSSCHDPHVLPGHTDPALLSRALAVQTRVARTRSATRVTLRIRADVVGHAVPTGDLLRELVVRAWPLGHPERAQSEVLGRALPAVAPGRRIEAIPDARIPPRGSRDVTLTLPGHHAHVAWDITLTALPAGHERARGLPEHLLRWPVVSGQD